MYTEHETLQQATLKETEAYAAHIFHHGEEPYRSQTTKWAEIKQGLNGKYYVPVCEHCDNSHDTIVESPEFPEVEE